MNNLNYLDELISIESNGGPKTLTIMTTYRCTAECAGCCFESSPKLKERLSLEQIKNNIQQAKDTYPNLETVVFSGGECFMLGDDLFESIFYATKLGLKTRCVTNAYWASSISRAKDIAKRLKSAGIFEMNISTGIDHKEWVPLSNIKNAVTSLIEEEISTLVTVEKDNDKINCFEKLKSIPEIKEILSNNSGQFTLMVNSWMPFQQTNTSRLHEEDVIKDCKPCDHIYNVSVITPHNFLSACCGLTMEHIPALKLGDLSKISLQEAYNNHSDDFLKMWLSADGPELIVDKLMGKGFLEKKYGKLSHPCQACVYLHKDDEINKRLHSDSHKFVETVISTLQMRKTLYLANQSGK